MSIPEYAILVIDDQIGKPGPFQDTFLKNTGQSADAFEFSTGQDDESHNSERRVLDQVGALWEGTPQRRLSLILLDVQFYDPSMSDGGVCFGFTLLRALRERFGPDLPIVMLTSRDEVRQEANALETDDFLPKPINRDVFEAMKSRHGLYPETTPGVMGTAPAFLRVLRDIRRAMADRVMELLLLGETGTGKSELANYVHQISKRTGRFEPYSGNSGNVDMKADELFGHWKDSFTGADGHSSGKAERAHEGTLFLDEIAELSPDTQTKLLEYRECKSDGYRRVSRHGTCPPEVRRAKSLDARKTRELDLSGTYSFLEDRILVDTLLIAATHQPIDDPRWRETASFRNDVFNRLAHRIHLPPLRERREDIARMFQAFMQRQGERALVLTEPSRQLLEAHEWREGNIAELKKVADIVRTQVGSGLTEVHPRHLHDLLAKRVQPPRGPESPEASRPPPGPATTPARFVDFEIASHRGLAERLRSAVVETRRLSRIGTLAEIWMQATGKQLKPADVKREIKEILEVWFDPNNRQRARWMTLAAYRAGADWAQGDTILRCLYEYSTKQMQWDDARAQIEAAVPPPTSSSQ